MICGIICHLVICFTLAFFDFDAHTLLTFDCDAIDNLFFIWRLSVDANSQVDQEEAGDH
jgi:hypothetical protein